MLQHYPQMQVESVENSYLNYSVASRVQNLCQESPIFWVVVDGLGWLDHLELLSLLTNNYKLAVETAIEPRFSILPTKTEYAKWSLYAQLFPNDSAWVADVGKAFVKMGMGKRYTDRQVDKLYNALRKKTSKLYCWDTDIFDSLYHSQKDWQSLYKLDRLHTLEGIAKKIDYCLQQYPDPDALRIVIASDHGQMIGTSEKITHCPSELEPKGRMAIGKTNDTRFVVLEGDRYGLPHDISIVKGSASLGSFSYTSNKKIIGNEDNLIANLPKFFAETALLDRLSGIVPGWKIPKFQREMVASQVGLKMDFFGKVLLSLRQDNRFMFYVEQHTKFAKNVTIRDQNAILKSASGFLKILYPHLELTLMDFERDCLEPACKLRQAIRNSLYYLDEEFRQFGRKIYVETK
ncbi:MAG: BREX system Lon protease-like protein BrxL [Nostoc sp.]|uniref:BREX system Lon protease-like protein BrxL n=1 Tax=Nostoc sp. TaxID=1180 RepID=UPI002FF19AB4